MFQQTPQNRVLFPRTRRPARVGGFVASVLVFAFIISIAVTVLSTISVAAATNGTLSFQARLENAAGNIAPDGNYFIEFNLYTAASGGSSVWREIYQGSAYSCAFGSNTGAANNKIEVKNGYLTANLGTLCTFPGSINWDQEMWITMKVGGSSGTASWDAEMNPRLKLTAVPYALRAGQLAQFNGANGFSSTLVLQGPTVGNQSFVLQDQGAAGTYNLCIQSSTACGFAAASGGSGYVQNGTGVQTANFNIQSASTGSVTAILQAAAGSYSDILQLKNNSGQTSISIDQSGNLIAGKTGQSLLLGNNAGTSNTAVLTVSSYATTSIAQIIRATSGQTADLLQVQNSASNTFISINAAGNLYTNGTANTMTGLKSPATVSISNVGTTGSTTYGYRVSALNSQGETQAAPTATTTTGNASLSGSNYNVVTFSPVDGATSYRVYGRATGSELLMTTITSDGRTGNYTYNDTGAATPSGALPTGSSLSTVLTLNAGSTSGQNLLSIRNSSGTQTASVNGIGNFYLSRGMSVGGTIVSAGAVANMIVVGDGAVGQVIKAATGQTSDQLQLQDANNAILSGMNANGGFYTNGVSSTFSNLAVPTFTTVSTGSAFYYAITATNAAGETVASTSLGMANATSALAWNQVAGATGYKIYRNSTNSFTSGSLLRTTITNGTTVSFTDTGAATTAGLPPTAPAGTSLTLQGWSGQANALLQFTLPNGVSSAYFDASGSYHGKGSADTRIYMTGNGSALSSTNARIQIETANSGVVGIVIQGMSGQSVDLLQFRDNSNAVLSKFDSAGNLTAPSVNATAGYNVAGTSVISSGFVLQNVTTDTAILTSGTLGVERGGTGATTLTTNGILFGNGTGAIQSTAAGTNGQCLIATTGVAPSWGSCGGGEMVSTNPQIIKVKTADQTVNNSVTYVDDNELYFDIGANETWSYQFALMQNSVTGAGLKIRVMPPAGSTVCRQALNDVDNSATVSYTDCTVTGQSQTTSTGTNETFEIYGVVTAGSTGGRVKMQWAQATATVGDTTIYAASAARAWRASGTGTTFQAFIQGGNSFGATALLGTNDSQALSLTTGGVARIQIGATGEISLNSDVTVANTKSISFTATNNNNWSGAPRIFSGSQATSLGSLTGTALTDVQNYGNNGEGIIMQFGGSIDTGGLKLTDDGVIIWGAGDENLFQLINEDTNTTAFTVNDAGVAIAAQGFQGSSFDINVAGTLSLAGTNATDLTLGKTSGTANVATTIHGTVLIKSNTNSAAAFQVQNTSSQSVMTADTSSGSVLFGQSSALNGTIKLANASNTNIITLVTSAATGSYTLTLPSALGLSGECLKDTTGTGVLGFGACGTGGGGGGGGQTRTVSLEPEYAGATMSADGTSNNGTMTSDFDRTNSRNYYSWSNSTGALNDYDIIVRNMIPSEYASGFGTFRIWAYANSTSTVNNDITVTVKDGAGTTCASAVSVLPGTANTWSQQTVTLSGCTFSANSKITVITQMKSLSNNAVRVGEISYQYTN